MRWLIGVLLVLVLAPGAQAATFNAAADSPENPDRAPAQDIARVVSTLNADTGTWSVTVVLRGEPAEGTTAAVNAVLYPPAASCGSMPNDAAAYLRGNDSPPRPTSVGRSSPARARRTAGTSRSMCPAARR